VELDYAGIFDRDNMCPVELLSSALASCVTLTLRAVAEIRGFPVESINVRVVTTPDYGRPARAEHRIEIGLQGNLSEKERTILFREAKSCHVHKLLSGENSFSFNLSAPTTGE
jgi:putative redox protein